MLDGMGIQLLTVSVFAEDGTHWEYLRAGIVALLTTETTDRKSG
jgi:hypothetical protein